MTLKELERRIRRLQPTEQTSIVKYMDGREIVMTTHDAIIECLRHPEIIESCDNDLADVMLYVGERDPETGEVVARRSPGPAELWRDYIDTQGT